MQHYDVLIRLDLKTPMRDGVGLSADLYLPRSKSIDERASERFPTVLIRTPYSNNLPELVEKARGLANHGYACVVQDVRGRWDSEGTYYPFHQEGADGYDTQQWIGRQEWSDGKIGMAGGSYLGCVQWLSLPHRSEYLVCTAPRVMCNDYYRGLFYPGGAFQLNVLMTWGMRTSAHTAQSISHHNWTEAFRTLPVQEMVEKNGGNIPFWKDWMQHRTLDDYWEEINGESRYQQMAAPALIMGGWFDLYAKDTFDNFAGMRQRGGTAEARQSKLIVGPWPHRLSACKRTGDVDFGAHSMVDLDALEMRWFDHWLKGIDNGMANEPPIRLFIMGAGEWRDENEWPLARTDWQTWHLHSEGNANTLLGDGTLSRRAPQDEPPDQFVYDPRYPVQTTGGNNCCSPEIVPWGPYDQRPVEMRTDVLCYTSGSLEDDIEVTGPIRLVLYAATDGPDTDWTAKLVDVAPSGYAMNLCDGILRARFRESLSQPKLIESGAVLEYTVDLGVTGNVFRRGHRIRLEVSSSNFPRFDRNLNTGGDMITETTTRAAQQTIHHSDEHPSHMVLPVVS